MSKQLNLNFPIETERCLIRAINRKDLPEFMIYRNNPEWMKFQGLKLLSFEAYEQKLFDEINQQEELQLVVIKRDENQLIGDLYLRKEGKEIWMGYSINPEYSRRGYAFETTHELISEISKSGHYEIIKVGILPQNDASRHLIFKLGFKFSFFDGEEDIFEYLLPSF